MHPNHLSKLWHMIKPGIEEVLDYLNKDCEQELWVPEDVYTSIKVGESQLWLGDAGFVVTQMQFDRFNGTKVFFVWIAYSYDSGVSVLDLGQEILEEYAKSQGCEMMKFFSTRKGFYKRALDMGYSIGPTTFAKRI